MSFYVVFGDPYYDNKTPWILEEYNGGGTVCYGGVWLLKKEKIISNRWLLIMLINQLIDSLLGQSMMTVLLMMWKVYVISN